MADESFWMCVDSSLWEFKGDSREDLIELIHDCLSAPVEITLAVPLESGEDTSHADRWFLAGEEQIFGDSEQEVRNLVSGLSRTPGSAAVADVYAVRFTRRGMV